MNTTSFPYSIPGPTLLRLHRAYDVVCLLAELGQAQTLTEQAQQSIAASTASLISKELHGILDEIEAASKRPLWQAGAGT